MPDIKILYFLPELRRSEIRKSVSTNPNAPFFAENSSNFLTPSGFRLGEAIEKGTGSLEWVPVLMGVG